MNGRPNNELIYSECVKLDKLCEFLQERLDEVIGVHHYMCAY